MKVDSRVCPGPQACRYVTGEHCGGSNSSAGGGHKGCKWVRYNTCSGGGSDCVAVDYSCDRFPLYKQCDPAWANNIMGPGTSTTVCDAGCLESSFSMALAGKNITINGKPANPGSVNEFARENGCFVSGTSDLLDACVDKIDPKRVSFQAIMHGHTSLSLTQINDWLATDPSKIIIANVLNGQHFVLVTGVDFSGQQIYVNDPGFTRDSYPYDDSLVGYNLWRIV